MTQPGSMLSLTSISKSYVGVKALTNVSLKVAPGEIVAVVGENGAGKSTLLKVLAGITTPDSGTITLDGVDYAGFSVRDSIKLGIGLIHQELNLAGELSVAENIFLGRQPEFGPRWLPFTDRQKMLAQAKGLQERIGLEVSLHRKVKSLSVGQRQQVEIAKALSQDARILVFDEPTSSLSFSEVERLLALVEQLRDRQVAIVYVTHHLHEVIRLASRVAVLRDGHLVGTIDGDQINKEKMISLMVGRDVTSFFQPKAHKVNYDQPALEVKSLTYQSSKKPVNFRLHRGEILGVAGLVGAGRTELARVLFGIDRSLEGEIRIHDRKVTIRSPVDAINQGMALVPEDRQLQGLLLSKSVRTNITLSALRQIAKLEWIDRKEERQISQKMMKDLSIRASSPEQSVKFLSGGNQQKVVLAKWLVTKPEILLLDEPTRGVDVGAKSEIYTLISSLAEMGMAILMISSEMEEVVGISDRVLVMREGEVVGELAKEQINEETILALAIDHQRNCN